MSADLCPRCGKSVNALLSDGVCPACLLAYAFADADDPTSAPEESLSHLGPYTLLEPLGEGGMGKVWKARHGGLDRLVALKVFHKSWADLPEFPARFRREARVLAALRHPRVVGVYDSGADGGVYYLAMEYVPGLTLRQRMGDGRLPLPEVAAIFGQLADALEHAHRAGVVHRDVKPENVLLDEAGMVKLGDFGIARLADEGERSSTLTASGRPLGTRCYMAPEQLTGVAPLDCRADVYALGVVLYEMVTGDLPLGVFAPPSKRADVRPAFDRVLLRALAKEPAERFGSVGDFRRAALGSLRPTASRRRALIVGLSTAGVVTAGLVARSFFGRQTSAPPRWPIVLDEHTGPVGCVAFSPDGIVLASASEDHTVRLWGSAGGKPVATIPRAFPGHEHGPLSVVFDREGANLFTAGRESVVRRWNARSLEERSPLLGHAREITALALSPDGRRLASAGLDLTVRLWNAADGTAERTIRIRPSDGTVHPPLSVAFSRDGKLLAAGLMSGEVQMWNLETGDQFPLKAMAGASHVRRVWAVAFGADDLLATGSHDRTIRLSPPRDGNAKPGALTVGHEVWAIAFSPDGRLLAAGSQDGVVRVWDVAAARLEAELCGHTDKVVSVAFDPTGNRLASGSHDRTVRLWQVRPLK